MSPQTQPSARQVLEQHYGDVFDELARRGPLWTLHRIARQEIGPWWMARCPISQSLLNQAGVLRCFYPTPLTFELERPEGTRADPSRGRRGPSRPPPVTTAVDRPDQAAVEQEGVSNAGGGPAHRGHRVGVVGVEQRPPAEPKDAEPRGVDVPRARSWQSDKGYVAVFDPFAEAMPAPAVVVRDVV